MKKTHLFATLLGLALLTPAPCHAAENSQELTQRGIEALRAKPLQDKDINNAIALFERATILDPKNTLARKDLAIAYHQYGLSLWRTEPTQALHEFEIAYYINPTEDIYENLKPIPVAKLIASAEESAKQEDWLCVHSLYLLALKKKADPQVAAKLRKVDAQIKSSKLPYATPISTPLK